jgi:hypothetical protein
MLLFYFLLKENLDDIANIIMFESLIDINIIFINEHLNKTNKTI